mmetsp:Transcript_12252/g.30504  ORF Transcript_12252/g.30504 Transcript_12252/m.30504 type:complete len:89 (+) Transcript_12252:401-667(+)
MLRYTAVPISIEKLQPTRSHSNSLAVLRGLGVTLATAVRAASLLRLAPPVCCATPTHHAHFFLGSLPTGMVSVLGSIGAVLVIRLEGG